MKINIKKLLYIFKNFQETNNRIDKIDKNTIALLDSVYKTIEKGRDQKEILRACEFNFYSQNGEDGILLYILTKIGIYNRNFIEFGIEDGKEYNTANLSINLGWKGLLMDGGKTNIRKAKLYYKNKASVDIKCCFVTVENINNILKEVNYNEDVDLLSIDIDGNDYWIWKEMKISPRIVIIEYNPSFGPKRSISVKYSPDFERHKYHPSGFYHGASITALTKLAKKKGYILVGCDSSGVNTFFVRKDIAKGKLHKLDPIKAYYPSTRRLRKQTTKDQFRIIKNMDYVHI